MYGGYRAQSPYNGLMLLGLLPCFLANDRGSTRTSLLGHYVRFWRKSSDQTIKVKYIIIIFLLMDGANGGSWQMIRSNQMLCPFQSSVISICGCHPWKTSMNNIHWWYFSIHARHPRMTLLHPWMTSMDGIFIPQIFGENCMHKNKWEFLSN